VFDGIGEAEIRELPRTGRKHQPDNVAVTV
jgi:hypothetical protein